jgi:hypothetical protein
MTSQMVCRSTFSARVSFDGANVSLLFAFGHFLRLGNGGASRDRASDSAVKVHFNLRTQTG